MASEQLPFAGTTGFFFIIVPIHGHADQLRQGLTSIRACAFSNCEIIVSDDGSTDSPLVRNGAEEHDAGVVRSEIRRGSAAARNLAAATARGDYLVFFDADVTLHREALKLIAEAFAGSRHIDAAASSYDRSPSAPGQTSQFRNLLHSHGHQQSTNSASTFRAAVRRECFLRVPVGESIMSDWVSSGRNPGSKIEIPVNTLPIACAIDHSYVLPLAVMLESLKHHLRPSFQPVLYLIHTGMPQHSLAAISSIVETHSIIPSEAQLSAAPRSPRFPREASFSLLLSELLPPALERVLFLDADLLVLQDLAYLWETPLDRYVLAAAPDTAVPLCSAPRGVKGWQALGIPPDAPYFNAGVLLIHLARCRQREVTRRVHQYLENTCEPIDFLHQEALNAVLWDDWKPLDSRWNLLASRAGRPYERPASDAWLQPGIVHFAGRMKPWRAPVGGPFNSRYRDVLERVLPLIPPEPPTLRDRFHSVYDRYLRAAFYSLEQYLWRQRLI